MKSFQLAIQLSDTLGLLEFYCLGPAIFLFLKCPFLAVGVSILLNYTKLIFVYQVFYLGHTMTHADLIGLIKWLSWGD